MKEILQDLQKEKQLIERAIQSVTELTNFQKNRNSPLLPSKRDPLVSRDLLVGPVAMLNKPKSRPTKIHKKHSVNLERGDEIVNALSELNGSATTKELVKHIAPGVGQKERRRLGKCIRTWCDHNSQLIRSQFVDGVKTYFLRGFFNG